MTRTKGISLPEIMMAAGIASILTLLLVLLFSRGQAVTQREKGYSQELRDLGKAMRLISNTLSEGTVFVVGPMEKLQSKEGSSEIQIEQFLEMYRKHKLVILSMRGGAVVRREYPPGAAVALAHEFSKPEKEAVLAESAKNIRFRIKEPGTLEVTLQGETLSLQTEISSVRIGEEK